MTIGHAGRTTVEAARPDPHAVRHRRQASRRRARRRASPAATGIGAPRGSRLRRHPSTESAAGTRRRRAAHGGRSRQVGRSPGQRVGARVRTARLTAWRAAARDPRRRCGRRRRSVRRRGASGGPGGAALRSRRIGARRAEMWTVRRLAPTFRRAPRRPGRPDRSTSATGRRRLAVGGDGLPRAEGALSPARSPRAPGTVSIRAGARDYGHRRRRRGGGGARGGRGRGLATGPWPALPGERRGPQQHAGAARRTAPTDWRAGTGSGRRRRLRGRERRGRRAIRVAERWPGAGRPATDGVGLPTRGRRCPMTERCGRCRATALDTAQLDRLDREQAGD